MLLAVLVNALQPFAALQVKNMLQRVKPDWSDDHFKFVPFQTHGDQDKEQQLRILGQGAFTGKEAVVVRLDTRGHSLYRTSVHVAWTGQ